MEKKDRIICLFLFLAFFGAGLIMALQLNIPPVLDEVGILANSAYSAGYDWSEAVYSIGGFYYKYGISIIYAPFLAFIDDPFVLYKALMAVNMFFYSFVPVFAYIITKKHLRVERKQSVLFSITAALVPCCVIYQLYAKADVLLIFLPWAVLYIFLELVALKKEQKRKKIILSVALSFFSIYAYAVHTRGLIVIIASVLTIVLAGILIKKCIVNIPAYVGSGIFFILIDRLMVNMFYNGVYGAYGTSHASAESFEFDYLLKIFSGEGMSTMSKLTGGWLFTGLTGTCGIIAIAVFGGVVFFVKEYKKYFKLKKVCKNSGSDITSDGKTEKQQDSEEETVISKETDPAETVFSIYSVLSLLGVFAMGLLFFFPVVDRYYTEEAIRRSDRVIYERYIAAAFGPAVLYGLYLLHEGQKSIGKKAMNIIRVVSGVFYSVIFIYFMVCCVKYIEGVKGCARNFIALTTFLEVDGGSTNAAFENIFHSFLLSGLLGIGVFIVIAAVTAFVKKKGLKAAVCCGTLIAVSLVIITVSFVKIRLSRDTVLVEWTSEPAGFLQDLPQKSRNYPVFWDVSAKDIKHYQFQLKDYTIGSYCTVTSKAKNCFVITQKGHYLKEYYNDDYYLFADFDYENANRDIVYVKGKKLAQAMEKAGYKMIKYEGKLKKAKLPEVIMPYKNPAEGG